MSISIGVGTGVGFVLSGVIISSFSYHWLFWFPLALIVPTLIATVLYVPESPSRPGGSIDWFGGALLTAGLLALLLAISEAQAWGWASSAIGLLAAGLAVLVVWTAVETEDRRAADRHGHDADPCGVADQRRRLSARRRSVCRLLGDPAVRRAGHVRPGTGSPTSVLTAGLFLVPGDRWRWSLIGPLAGVIDAAGGSKVPARRRAARSRRIRLHS